MLACHDAVHPGIAILSLALASSTAVFVFALTVEARKLEQDRPPMPNPTKRQMPSINHFIDV